MDTFFYNNKSETPGEVEYFFKERARQLRAIPSQAVISSLKTKLAFSTDRVEAAKDMLVRAEAAHEKYVGVTTIEARESELDVSVAKFNLEATQTKDMLIREKLTREIARHRVEFGKE